MDTKSINLALKISIYLTLILGLIYALFNLIILSDINWLVFVGVLLLFFVSSFAIFRYTFQKYIYSQIKIIYETIFQVRNKALPDKVQRGADILGEVSKQAQEWAQTKSKEIEKLKQLENYRKEFLGNVSHELKTPIFNIQGYILTLIDGGLDDPNINMKYLMRAEKSIERMINIVKDLESISKLETGEMQLQYFRFNIDILIKEMIDAFEIRAAEKKIKLKFTKDFHNPSYVFADKSRISQVLTNLISNSINYGNENGGETVITIHDVDDKILVQVSDNGIGIDSKHLSRLFERFYRVDKSRSRDSGGTGLGLAIVKHIIDAHGQSLNVTSEYGKGSCFSFTLSKA